MGQQGLETSGFERRSGRRASGRVGARSTRPLGSALRARARPSRTPPPAPGRLAGPPRAAGPRTPPSPAGTPGARARRPPPPRPAGARRLPLPLQLAAAAGIVFVVAEAGRALREPGPGSPGRAPPPPPAQRPRLRGAASAPIFRRASVTRRRRRGPEREAPGTGARRPPSPPWRRWDPVRSALRPGPGSGAREGRRSGGRDCRCPAAARGDPDAGCQAPGRKGTPCPRPRGAGTAPQLKTLGLF